MQKPTLVLLAAGMGSRFGGLKQMAGLGPGGEVLLEYSIYDALKAGFGRVVFIIRGDIESDFRQLVVGRLPDNLEVDFVFQELDKLPEGFTVPAGRTKPWGTAHALWCAKEKVTGNFAVLNADDFYGYTGFQRLFTFFNQNTEKQADGALVGYRLDKTLSESGVVTRGICRQNEDGHLTHIEEVGGLRREGSVVVGGEDESKIEMAGNELASMNFWGFTSDLFLHLDRLFTPWLAENGRDLKSEFLLPTAIGALVASVDLKVLVLDSADSWIGVTYAADSEPTQAQLLSLSNAGVYPERLWM